ncbi:hypothetical protein, partial [Mesorhizobium sp.]|uniref:hypothetical protein n=1 Tax=Mesorhizobium sp. TaxID=1871066 RepID=UPI0025808125
MTAILPLPRTDAPQRTRERDIAQTTARRKHFNNKLGLEADLHRAGRRCRTRHPERIVALDQS